MLIVKSVIDKYLVVFGHFKGISSNAKLKAFFVQFDDVFMAKLAIIFETQKN